jgi:hypothetical protein
VSHEPGRSTRFRLAAGVRGEREDRQARRSKLREVDFKFGDTAFRGVEQNPSTNSRWAKLAREGKKVMQFLVDGRYVAGIVDGKVTVYHSVAKPGR